MPWDQDRLTLAELTCLLETEDKGRFSGPAGKAPPSPRVRLERAMAGG